jgi:hypothetical protein
MTPWKFIMRLYQYAYYWMIEGDKSSWGGKLPEMTSMYKALLVFMIVEWWWIFGLYIFIVNVLLNTPIRPNNLEPTITLIIGGGILLYANRKLIGSKTRIDHYRKIFYGWDKWKHLRCKIYLILISISGFIMMLLAGEASRKMLVP